MDQRPAHETPEPIDLPVDVVSDVGPGTEPPSASDETTSQTAARSPRHPSRWLQSVLVFTGVVLPFLCFAIGFPEQPRWQSGDLRDYLQLLMSRPPMLPLYPFWIFSMICLALFVFSPERSAKRLVVRVGIYLGALLSLEYWTLFVLAFAGQPVVLSLLVGLIPSAIAIVGLYGLVYCVVLIRRKLGGKAANVAIGVISLVYFVGMTAVDGDPVMPFVLPIFLSFFFAAPWAVTAYVTASVLVWRIGVTARWQFSLRDLLGLVTLLSLHIGAWRTSVLWMLQEYRTLPTEPPGGCYVCSAAARGHRRVVRSEACFDGAAVASFPVNDQLRRLKAAELMLAVGLPRFHRMLRIVYDAVGPILAAMLVHPLLADLAYLSLKPAEWMARTAIAVLLPGGDGLVRTMYPTAEERTE